MYKRIEGDSILNLFTNKLQDILTENIEFYYPLSSQRHRTLSLEWKKCYENLEFNLDFYKQYYELILLNLRQILNIGKTKELLECKKYEEFVDLVQNLNIIDANNSQGIVFTPPEIAEFMVTRSMQIMGKQKSKHILDLCSGIGVFTLQIAENLSTDNFTPQEVLSMIHAVDIDKHAIMVLRARLLIWALFRSKELGISISKTLKDNYSAIINKNIATSNIFANPKDSEYLSDPKTNRFDLIISNPPYISEKGNKKLMDVALSRIEFTEFYSQRMDYYLFFMGYALNHLEPSGLMAFITPNYYLYNQHAVKIRKGFCEHAQYLEIIDFVNMKIFKNAPGFHACISLLKQVAESTPKTMEQPTGVYISIGLNKQEGRKTPFDEIGRLSKQLSLLAYPLSPLLSDDKHSGEASLQLDGNLILKITRDRPSSLFDSANDYVFTLHSDSTSGGIIKNALLSPNKIAGDAKVSQGVIAGPDTLNSKNSKHLEPTILKKLSKNAGIFILSVEELKALKLKSSELGLTIPFLYPRFIDRDFYFLNDPSKVQFSHFILYIDRETEPERFDIEYPNINHHLNQFKCIMEKRRETLQGKNKWFQLHWPRTKRIFFVPRIICLRMVKQPRFLYSEIPFVTDLSTNIITTDNLNALAFIYFSLTSTIGQGIVTHMAKKKGEQLQIDGNLLRKFPLPNIPFENLPNLYTLLKMFQYDSHTILKKFIDDGFCDLYSKGESSELSGLTIHIEKSKYITDLNRLYTICCEYIKLARN